MYRVEWLQPAIDELAAIWVAADSNLRKRIVAASNELDANLQTDPLNQSETRPGGRRICVVLPLVVMLRIELNQDVVSILNVRCV